MGKMKLADILPILSLIPQGMNYLPSICTYPTGANVSVPLGVCQTEDCAAANLCVFQELKSEQYANETIKRIPPSPQIRRLMDYASAAYCDDVSGWKCNNCMEESVLNNITDVYDSAADTHGFVGADHKTKSIVVAFRGSSSLVNWRTNFSFLPVTIISQVLESYSITLHRGFYAAAYSVYGTIRKLVQDLREQYANYKLQITGHSLGAALALTLAFLFLHNNAFDKNLMEIVTFAQPKVGNQQFAKYMLKQGVPVINILNRDDWVPKSPPIGYTHFGYILSYQDLTKPCIFKKNGQKICKEDQVLKYMNEHSEVPGKVIPWNLYHTTLGGYVFDPFCGSGESYS